MSATSEIQSWRSALADARLAREHRALRERLVALARFRYRLSVEDCEEIAADALLAWHQQLTTADGVRDDSAYLQTVLRHRALDRKKRPAAEMVELSALEGMAIDPELDLRLAEREELRDLAELARDLLDRDELEILVLSGWGVPRCEIARRHGLTVRQVERWIERAQHKLDDGARVMRERGRCAMLTLAISDVKTGRAAPGTPRHERGARHLRRCRHCRTTSPVPQLQVA